MKKSSEDIVYVSEFVDLVGPETEMLGPVKDGGRIVTGTEAACYGPMITPEVEKWTHDQPPRSCCGCRSWRRCGPKN